MAILNSAGTAVVNYVYDAWGRPISCAGTMASTLGKLNPFRYRGYVYDEETGFCYASSRYYVPKVARWLNADDVEYLGADGTLSSYSLYTYCNNNPVVGYDPDGTFDWGSLVQGCGWLATGAAALAVGISVITCGIAAPAMIAVAAVTVVAGVATAVNGASEVGEAFTGKNFVRDEVFQGNSDAYNAYAQSTAFITQVGTTICGGWLNANKSRIADHKLQQIIDDPQSVSQYNTKQFENIAKQSSWQCGPSKNLKGFRAVKGDCSIRYSMNGTRFDAAHFNGKPYWVVSSSAAGKVKVPM